MVAAVYKGRNQRGAQKVPSGMSSDDSVFPHFHCERCIKPKLPLNTCSRPLQMPRSVILPLPCTWHGFLMGECKEESKKSIERRID